MTLGTLSSLVEHSCSLHSHTHHPGWHDAPHPLCQGRPRVAACDRLLGHSGVLQLRLRSGDHHLHWDEQDQGYCHQWSHLHGETISIWFAHLRNRMPFCSIYTAAMRVYVFVSGCLMLTFQHQIIYYLCVLLKDPSEPNAVCSVVPLFQVRLFAK